MANLAFQVTNFAFQGDGQFVFQGSSGGAVVVPPPPIPPGNIDWLKKKRLKKRRKIVKPETPKETLSVELPTNLPISSLRAVLDEMEEAGFDFIESEEEDTLILTFLLKKLNG